MKIKCIFHMAMLCAAALATVSFNQEYDPIGNNKPSPLLSITPARMTFDGAGGEATAAVTTNVDAVVIGEKPDWIESVALSDDGKTLSVKAAPNTDPTYYRTAVLSVRTESGGDNEATQYLRFIQAAQDAAITYEGFTGKSLPSGWQVNGDTGGVAFGTAMTVPANTYVLNRNSGAQVTQADNRVVCTVDVKGGQGGLITYVNDDPNDTFLFAFSVNAGKTAGFFFAAKKGGSEPMAMDNFPQEGLDPIPAAADDYFRIEFTSAEKHPNWWQAQVSVYSLKNNNGQLEKAGKHYTRQFEIDNPKPQPGYFGVICREGTSQFRDFILSAQPKQ